MSRAAATLLAVLALVAAPPAALACSPTAPPDPAIPTWQQVNGFALGTREATDDEIYAYLAALGRATPRIAAGVAGQSLQGRPLEYAVVGDPATIAPRALTALSSQMRALRAGRLGATATRRLLARDPAFAWIAGGVHGGEPSGGDADMRVLYDLASGRDCTTLRILHRLVTVVMPVQNPDGRALDTRTNAAGFDLNRDWFARTQPETQAKVALVERYPPILFVDQHEEGGSGFFFPPNTDPIHHEIGSEALHAIDGIFGPALARAFDAHGYPHVSSSTYDLFFMGYGDSAPTTLFGAAGMTFEQGTSAPYPDRVAHHLLAAETALATAAAHERDLLHGWARGWSEARAQGARGQLQPNRAVVPGDTVRFGVPRRKVYGYVLRADLHGADASELVRRLMTVGVEVDRLRRPVRVRALHSFGVSGAAPATLPAGTWYVPMAQTAKHWVEAMLDEDAYVPIPYFYDVSSWSRPLLMGLAGGSVSRPIPAGFLRRGRTADTMPPSPAAGAAAYAFAGGAEGSADLAAALLEGGTPVARRPSDGAFVVPGGAQAALFPAARARQVALARVPAMPGGLVALRSPRVALLAPAQLAGAGSGSQLSPAWAAYLLERRLGLPATHVGVSDIEAGRLASGGFTALVVPNGAAQPGGLSPAATLALQSWVRGGGTLVAWGARGIELARAAGLTAVTATPAADAGLQAPGAALRILLAPTDPVAWGEQSEGFAFDTGDPVLTAHGAPVVASYPSDSRFFVSGYTSGAQVLRGTPAATDERVGSGRVVLFAFDPAFRGYTEGTERLAANALLAPNGQR